MLFLLTNHLIYLDEVWCRMSKPKTGRYISFSSVAVHGSTGYKLWLCLISYRRLIILRPRSDIITSLQCKGSLLLDMLLYNVCLRKFEGKWLSISSLCNTFTYTIKVNWTRLKIRLDPVCSSFPISFYVTSLKEHANFLVKMQSICLFPIHTI